MKIDIGGGHNPKAGFKSVDLIKDADYVCNIEKEKLPFEDESVEEIYSHHTFEHISNIIHLMNECWRVLKWNGRLEIIVPHIDCVLAWQDPTHKRYYNTESMKFFEGTYINKYKLDYGINCAFKKIICQKKIIKEKTDTDNLEDKTYFTEIHWILEKNKDYYEKNKPFNIKEKIPEEEITLEFINKEMQKEIDLSFNLFKKKNSDYNNTYFIKKFEKGYLFNNFERKYIRLEEYYKKNKEFKVEDETLLDTLRDLAIYSLMEIVRLKTKK